MYTYIYISILKWLDRLWQCQPYLIVLPRLRPCGPAGDHSAPGGDAGSSGPQVPVIRGMATPLRPHDFGTHVIR